jgi:hypothetical protein
MTLLFQACVGPSASKCHIRANQDQLVLCEATSYARSVVDNVHYTAICVKCIYQMAARIRQEKLAGGVVPKVNTREELAQAIGVEKIL